MSHIDVIRHEALYPDAKDISVKLLIQRPDLEIMHQRLGPESVAWLVPAEDKTTTEFYCVLAGRVTLYTEPPQELGPGDSFTVELLTEEVRMASQGSAELLCVTNRSAYDDVHSFSEQLQGLVERVNDKDHYTSEHCQHVMKLSVKLYQLLADREGLLLDSLVPAAIFHDVGKCEIADEILKKPGRYTPEEYAEMKRHPLESERILSDRYGGDVARIARLHHERVDGTGYPDGLRGEQIPLGARILAVADSFDAMTAGRPYAPLRTYEEALRELRARPDGYDPRVLDALEALLATGRPIYEAI